MYIWWIYIFNVVKDDYLIKKVWSNFIVEDGQIYIYCLLWVCVIKKTLCVLCIIHKYVQSV
jgi:hypothetical protein